MNSKKARHFREELRVGRLEALRDSERYSGILHAIERIGRFMHPGGNSLYDYKSHLAKVAAHSPLSEEIPNLHRPFHIPFGVLYELVRKARNEAAHEGAYARHLASHAIELALILEDGLMKDLRQAADYMVAGPVVAEPWHPVSFARHRMLSNSFSFLPMFGEDGKWVLVSDQGIAKFLRQEQRSERMGTTLHRAAEVYPLLVEPAITCRPTDPIDEVVQRMTHIPCLVIDASNPARLLGILTAFDVL